MECNACGSRDFVPLGHLGRYGWFRCRACGMDRTDACEHGAPEDECEWCGVDVGTMAREDGRVLCGPCNEGKVTQ